MADALTAPAPATRDRNQAIRLASGRLFWPLDPLEHEIFIEDIAHGLSQICRFNGHTQAFYSVAQHSVLVSQLCPPADALFGLLHDASEAYLGDVARPIKHSPVFAAYRGHEARLQQLVFHRFGLAGPEPTSIKLADVTARHIELRALIQDSDPKHAAAAGAARQLVPHKPELARHLFLQRFEALINRT